MESFMRTGYQHLYDAREGFEESDAVAQAPIHPKLKELYAADAERKREIYNAWAMDYDQQILAELGYVAAREAVELFVRHFREYNGLILDAACGTGLAGLELSEFGFPYVEGMDLSLNMLERSTKKVVYKRFIERDVNEPLGLDGRYHGIVCAGLFGYGDPGLHCLTHLVQALKPEGICVATVNAMAWDELGLENQLMELSAQGRFVVEKIKTQPYIRLGDIKSQTIVVKNKGS